MTTKLGTALCLALFLTPALARPVQEPAQRPAAQEEAQIYDEQADARKDVAAALAVAKRENKRVLIQWGANWCKWCKLLHGTFESDRDVADKLLYEYEVVLVDIGRFDKHMDLAQEYGADLKANGVPFLTVLNAEGEAIANRETGSLETKVDGKDAHDPEKVVAFLTQQQAKYRKAADVLAEGMADARAQGKRLLLTFGAPWCGWCHRFEDWMRRPQAAALLAKDFVICKVDTDRTLGGEELLAQYREGQGGIPWFVFLDRTGAALANSGVGGENLGCPWSDEEIARFGELLSGVTRRLTKEDVAALTADLRSFRDEREAAARKEREAAKAREAGAGEE